MATHVIEWDLDREKGEGVIIFRLNGASLTVICLDRIRPDTDWYGEIGNPTSKACRHMAEQLADWIRSPGYTKRGELKKFDEELAVMNYAECWREDGDSQIEPGLANRSSSVTISVESVRDAEHLQKLFVEYADRMEGIHPWR
ncbi:MAG TPA: hypothetical protein VMU11_00700 [Verrucomicrobiae bacterium]|nr:hypothetical protein [Verrucomicrobiae bacterium]